MIVRPPLKFLSCSFSPPKVFSFLALFGWYNMYYLIRSIYTCTHEVTF